MELYHGFDRQRFIAPTGRTPYRYADYLDAERQRPDTIVLVAESYGRVVGDAYAVLEGSDSMALRGPAGVLYDLIVDPKCRQRSIGGALVEAARARLVAMGAPRIVLSTAVRNQDAQRLFTVWGFRATMIEMTSDSPAPRSG